jgi:quercetin dioxygenase-like cupin family protein
VFTPKLEQSEKTKKGWARTGDVLISHNATVGRVAIVQDVVDPSHEQIVWMLKGRMDFRSRNDQRSMVAGDVAVIPGNTEHDGLFLEDTEVVDVFAPPREDFLAGGTPSYMRVP